LPFVHILYIFVDAYGGSNRIFNGFSDAQKTYVFFNAGSVVHHAFISFAELVINVRNIGLG
jgi:hypothetical protein